MFKNAIIYKFQHPGLSASVLEEALDKCRFVQCGATQPKSAGFVPPREENGAMAEAVGGQIIIKLKSEVRKVPGQTVKRRTEEIAAQMEQETGRKPGKKLMKELKEQALQELLPMAFTAQSTTLCWINPKAGTILVDTGSATKAEDVISLLVKVVDDLQVSMLQTETSPCTAMAHWLGSGEAPFAFTIDRECELKSPDEMKSTVKYGRHPLDTEEVKAHIVAGKLPTRVAMTWRDRLSFVLTDSMLIKKLAFLDVVVENKSQKDSQDDAFDADVSIVTGELSSMLPDLLEALGGEQVVAQASPSAPAAKRPHTDPLYPDAADVVVAMQDASVSILQDQLQIGAARAASLLKQMEEAGLVGQPGPDGKRQINDLVAQASTSPWDA